MRLFHTRKTAAQGDRGWEPGLKPGPENAQKLLFHAAAKGGADAARTAIQYNADVDARDFRNETPLMRASAAHHVGVVKTLIKFRADPFALDDDNLTARGRLETAKGLTGIVRALKKYLIVRALKAYEEEWTLKHPEEPEIVFSD
jgi:hypothetical protein